MPGDSLHSWDRARPRRSSGSVPESSDAEFWADSKRTARARHAARSRHPGPGTEGAAGPTRGDAGPLPDPVEEFARAMEEYRRASGRMFPTWCEVLEVLRSLGYTRLNSPGVSLADRDDTLGFVAKGET